MKKLVKVKLLILLLFFPPIFAYADIIYLKNGNKIEGEISEKTNKGIFLKIFNGAGKIFIKNDDIEKIETIEFSERSGGFTYHPSTGIKIDKDNYAKEKVSIIESKTLKLVKKKEEPSYEWREKEVTFNFDIYYRNADKEFIEKVESKAEGYYQSIRDKLGFLFNNGEGKFIYTIVKKIICNTRELLNGLLVAQIMKIARFHLL